MSFRHGICSSFSHLFHDIQSRGDEAAAGDFSEVLAHWGNAA